MAANLLTLLREQFDENAVSHLGVSLGETPAVISKALDGVLPTVMGGVAQHSKDPGAPASLLSLLQTSATDSNLIESFSDPVRTQSAIATGNTLLTRIFGDKTGRITDTLATYSGAKSTSIGSLLGLAAATLMGLLNRQSSATSALTATGLTDSMAGQADIVGNAMPTGLASLLPLIGIGVIGTQTTTIKQAAPVTPVAPLIEDRAARTPWLRWLLIVLGILLLLWLLRSCFDGDKKTSTVVTDSTATVAPVNTDTVASAVGTGVMADSKSGPAVEIDVELPGGRRIKVAERSFNATLADYLAKQPKAPFRTFTFDNLTFDTNSAIIKGESETHVNELTEIMQAYPQLVIRIEGHTDNTGSESANETLSQERADAVKTQLVKAGIAADRVTTKGFASEKPTATNQTQEGRQENRRIDVVIVKA